MNNDVAIRPIEVADLERIRAWINKDDVRDNLLTTAPADAREQAEWFDTYRKDETKAIYAIEYRRRHIGNISLFNIHPRHKRADLSIFIGDEARRNRGVGATAMMLLLEKAFCEYDLAKVSLRVLSSNAQAIACYKRVGMKEDGVLRSHVVLHGKRQDMLLFSILAEEFLTGKRDGEIR